MKSRWKSDGDERWEYVLLAQADKATKDRIDELQKSLLEEYRDLSKAAIIDEPAIAVARFTATESMEETLIRWIGRILGQSKGFEVTLNNYGGFPPPCIYIRVQDHQPFLRIAQELKIIDDYIRSNGCPPLWIVKRPHLLLAGNIDSGVYEKVIGDYSLKTFHESFVVSEFILLKRRDEFSKSNIVNVFRLFPPDTHNYGRVA